jgi:hypothetical protein
MLAHPEAAKKHKADLAKAQAKYQSKLKQLCITAFFSDCRFVTSRNFIYKFYFCNQDPELAKKQKTACKEVMAKYKSKLKQVCITVFKYLSTS